MDLRRHVEAWGARWDDVSTMMLDGVFIDDRTGTVHITPTCPTFIGATLVAAPAPTPASHALTVATLDRSKTCPQCVDIGAVIDLLRCRGSFHLVDSLRLHIDKMEQITTPGKARLMLTQGHSPFDSQWCSDQLAQRYHEAMRHLHELAEADNGPTTRSWARRLAYRAGYVNAPVPASIVVDDIRAVDRLFDVWATTDPYRPDALAETLLAGSVPAELLAYWQCEADRQHGERYTTLVLVGGPERWSQTVGRERRHLEAVADHIGVRDTTVVVDDATAALFEQLAWEAGLQFASAPCNNPLAAHVAQAMLGAAVSWDHVATVAVACTAP